MPDMPDHITDSQPHADKPEADENTTYYDARQREFDDAAQLLFEDARLVSDINMMIARIAKTNTFDKIDMDFLLKRARDRIERS